MRRIRGTKTPPAVSPVCHVYPGPRGWFPSPPNETEYPIFHRKKRKFLLLQQLRRGKLSGLMIGFLFYCFSHEYIARGIISLEKACLVYVCLVQDSSNLFPYHRERDGHFRRDSADAGNEESFKKRLSNLHIPVFSRLFPFRYLNGKDTWRMTFELTCQRTMRYFFPDNTSTMSESSWSHYNESTGLLFTEDRPLLGRTAFGQGTCSANKARRCA